MAMPLDVFHEIGGFDTSFPFAAGEDREFCDRWHAEGLPSAYVRDAVVYHEHDLDFSGFVRQHFTYGRGAYHFHQARRRREGGSFTVEPPSFYMGLVGYPFNAGRTGRAWLQSGLLALSQIANASGFFWERFRAARSRHGG
jgi:GT2 family glycosyltransferase